MQVVLYSVCYGSTFCPEGMRAKGDDCPYRSATEAARDEIGVEGASMKTG
jgi:hypothetical protein